MATATPSPQGTPGDGREISPDAVRRQLDRLLGSPQLVNSAQLCRFLRHLVEKTLAGETTSLKEGLLGLDVFERGVRFDPRTDPVVRVEARRLRSKLDEYYASTGSAGDVIVSIPKGSYVPVFGAAGNPVAGVQPAIPQTPAVRRIGRTPLAIAAVILLAASLFWVQKALFAAPSTLAVLPFANVGMDPETEYFADGLTDELTDLLGRTEGLRVVARSSAYQYKGKVVDARLVGTQLKADVLLEGSVRKEGQNLRVTTQLVDARTGYQIWSQRSEREWTQVFAMQQAIAASIASKLRVRPAGGQGHRTPNLESYNLYLKGRYLWNKRTVPGMQGAIAAFGEAIDKDPKYSAAWAGLADAYSMLGFMDALPPREIHQKAAEAAERAVQLDDTLAEAHVAQATVRALYDWDWPGAERSLRRAVQLNANLSQAHYSLSKLLFSIGRQDEGLSEIRRAQDLDPLSLMVVSSRGWELAAARRYRESDDAFRMADDLDPAFVWSHLFRAWSYQARGQWNNAIDTLNRAGTLTAMNSVALGELAHALGRAGRKDESARVLDRLTSAGAGHYISPYDLSRAYEGLGRRDDAMAALARACDDRSPIIVFLKVEPVFDEWRADPRFHEILRRLHME